MDSLWRLWVQVVGVMFVWHPDVQAEEKVQAQADYNHEYLPIEGYAPFNVSTTPHTFKALALCLSFEPSSLRHLAVPLGLQVACRALIFGADHEAVTSERITTVQGLSGTGCLRVGLEFLR